MIKKTIHRLLRRRHFWREIGFDELSELYASMFLRSLSTSLIGIFVPIFLYKQGISLEGVCLYYVVFFAFRIAIDIIAAFVVGRIGPKHTIVLSTIFTIINLMMLMTLKTLHWPLVLVSLTNAIATSLFFIAFHTDFSKVKDALHGGKELGYLLTMQNIGGVLGPLVGGIIATVYDVRYTIFIAISLLAFSLVPLFTTNEAVRLHQHITFKGFVWRPHARAFVSYACFGTENIVCTLIWPLFVSLVVFTSGTYAKLGAVTALSTGLTLLFINFIGRSVDKKQDRLLMRCGVAVNIVLHLLRTAVTSSLGVIGVNSVNDPISSMYRMPYIKHYYDFSDSVPGYRIVYIALSEAASQVGKMLMWLGIAVAMHFVPFTTAVRGAFVVAACISLGILLQPRKVNDTLEA